MVRISLQNARWVGLPKADQSKRSSRIIQLRSIPPLILLHSSPGTLLTRRSTVPRSPEQNEHGSCVLSPQDSDFFASKRSASSSNNRSSRNSFFCAVGSMFFFRRERVLSRSALIDSKSRAASFGRESTLTCCLRVSPMAYTGKHRNHANNRAPLPSKRGDSTRNPGVLSSCFKQLCEYFDGFLARPLLLAFRRASTRSSLPIVVATLCRLLATYSACSLFCAFLKKIRRSRSVLSTSQQLP